ncbi:SAV_915 family protein [Kineococcus sp. SYSU DK005]|uniref:SAV_915 family protein n=1 Tax=Kineococcus sp. SYSU DK005 TaxID=3383126 RepID=UPI003D7DD89F
MHTPSSPAPSPRTPSSRPAPLLVPVRPTPAGCRLAVFADARGRRTAVAFTSRELMHRVLGEQRPHVELAERAVRALLAPLGVDALVVDPVLCAPLPAPLGGSAPAVPAAVPAPAVTTAPAAVPAPRVAA